MEKMKNKLLFVLAIVLLATSMFLVGAKAEEWNLTSQPDIKWMKVYLKGELVFYGECIITETPADSLNAIWTCKTYNGVLSSLERGETIDVRVVFEGGSEEVLDNVIVRAWFRTQGTTVEDETPEFDVYKGNTYVRTLYLRLPSNMDSRTFTLHVDLEGERTFSGISSADIYFDTQRLSNDLQIKSINTRTTCGTACNTVYADIVVKNTGNHRLEDIYVKATIKELGISGTAYIDTLVPYHNDDYDSDEDISRQVSIALNLPANIRTGTYTLEVKAYNDDTETIETQQFPLQGQETSTVEIIAQTIRQDAEKGKGIVYTLLVTNRGTSTQTFTVETTGLEGWASSQINPASFSLAAGESKLVSLYIVSNEDAVTGEHLFTAKVRYGQEMKSFNFITNLTEPKTTLDIKSILMIIGIVLAVAIVILLIVLLTQKRSEGEKPEETYY